VCVVLVVFLSLHYLHVCEKERVCVFACVWESVCERACVFPCVCVALARFALQPLPARVFVCERTKERESEILCVVYWLYSSPSTTCMCVKECVHVFACVWEGVCERACVFACMCVCVGLAPFSLSPSIYYLHVCMRVRE